jgi:hypothetical protein
MLLSWAVVCVVIAVAVGYLSSAYPYVKNIKAAPVAIQGSTVTIKGSVDIYFTDRAWEEIGYKRGNFYHFDKYWQSQEGHKYSYLGYTVTLVHMDWTLVKHYRDHDRLSFVMKVKIL